jgi:hypothetical protein
MSLESIPNASLERRGYHELSEEQLRLKDDPEALLIRGIRLKDGTGVRMYADRGRGLITSSAKLAHPVALALCISHGYGARENQQRSVELYRDSASRGHAAGI